MTEEIETVVAKIDRSVAVGTAVTIAASLVRREESRRASRMNAYVEVGRKIGMSGAWVRKLIAGAVRSVDADIKHRLDALLIRELEADIARLQHELEMARQGGSHPSSQHVVEIEAHLKAAHSLMAGGCDGS